MSIIKYPIMESFYTIQGEGGFSGAPAYFIRFGGCDVGCVWCDVKESWPIEGHPEKTTEELINEVKLSGAKIAVITGGEPLMYDLGDLCEVLGEHKIRRHIETSGAYKLTGEWEWICFSPKKFLKPKEDLCRQADELKIIVYNKSDFKWAEEYASKVSSNCKLYLQPEFSREKEMLPLIINYVKENPKWNISLQIHKIMNIP
ncbi:MAG: 7-carboxy-7-deazaguanine synthase QueE [Cytophagales bacterium]